jgi:hypothetical protein
MFITSFGMTSSSDPCNLEETKLCSTS